jgi:hypothetical protein
MRLQWESPDPFSMREAQLDWWPLKFCIEFSWYNGHITFGAGKHDIHNKAVNCWWIGWNGFVWIVGYSKVYVSVWGVGAQLYHLITFDIIECLFITFSRSYYCNLGCNTTAQVWKRAECLFITFSMSYYCNLGCNTTAQVWKRAFTEACDIFFSWTPRRMAVVFELRRWKVFIQTPLKPALKGTTVRCTWFFDTKLLAANSNFYSFAWTKDPCMFTWKKCVSQSRLIKWTLVVLNSVRMQAMP